MKEHKRCANCGKILFTDNVHRKYCSNACKQHARNIRINIIKNPKKPHGCESPKVDQLTKDAAEAKRLGVSYGRYSSLLREGGIWR